MTGQNFISILLMSYLGIFLTACGGGSEPSTASGSNSIATSSATYSNYYHVILTADAHLDVTSPFGNNWLIESGSSTLITFAPDVGYVLDRVMGCGGSLEGLSYRTGAMTQDCTITATSKNTFVGVAGITDPVLAQCIYDTGVKSVEELTVLECDGKGVSSIEGLSSFTNLKKLSIQGEARPDTPYYSVGKQIYDIWFATKRLSGYLDFSLLTKLTYLNLNYNYGIELIDLSKNIELTYLNLGHSAIKFLDVSSLSELTTLFVHDNNLKAIDLSHNTKLTFLDLGDADYNYLTDYYGDHNFYRGSYGNTISNLDISMLTELTDLYLSYLRLTTIDLSQNTKLTNLHINANGMTYINERLPIEKHAPITAIDLSRNTQLVTLDVSDNLLTSLDVSALTQLTSLAAFKNQLDNISLPLNNTALTELNISANKLLSLGLGSLAALTTLDASHNLLLQLDLSNNTKLISLDLSDNTLSSLDFSNLPDLKEVSLSSNQFVNVSFSGNPKLTHVVLDNNQLISFDASNLTMLSDLSIARNLLTSINFSSSNLISSLNLDNNHLASLDVGGFPLLENIYLADNRELTSLSVSENNKALAEIRMNDCGVTSLNTMVLPALTDLRIMRCPLATIDFTNNAELNYLDLRGDLLTVVDFTNNTKLLDANLQDNKLTDILGVECISRKAVTLNLVMNNFNDRTFTYLEKLRLKTGYTNLNY